MIPGFGLRIAGCDPKAKVVDLIPDALATESWKCGSLVVKAPVSSRILSFYESSWKQCG